MENIELIKKNNELFANALTLKLIGKQDFMKLLYNWGFDDKKANDHFKVYNKFLNDYENKVNNVLLNLQK